MWIQRHVVQRGVWGSRGDEGQSLTAHFSLITRSLPGTNLLTFNMSSREPTIQCMNAFV